MLSFTPSANLEKALKAVQADVNRLAAEPVRVPDAEATWLHRWALIGTIGASTRIENAVLTDAEIEWVDTALSQDGHFTACDASHGSILEKLSKHRERSVEKAVGCREILSIVYPLAGGAVSVDGEHYPRLAPHPAQLLPAARFYAGGYKTSPNRVVAVNHDTGERRSGALRWLI